MAKRKKSSKLSLSIRVDNKGDYVIEVDRTDDIKKEGWVVSTIEDVERYVSSLLRSGKAPK